jgi:hypothetical protein
MKKYVTIIVIVALAIAGATAYAIVQQNAAQAAFEDGVQCQSLCENWLKNEDESYVQMAFSGGIPPGYNTHYNRKLGTCLIALSTEQVVQSAGSNNDYYWVINLLTNETVAGFDSINGGATTTYTHGMGNLDFNNATIAQYDAEEKQLMTE